MRRPEIAVIAATAMNHAPSGTPMTTSMGL